MINLLLSLAAVAVVAAAGYAIAAFVLDRTPGLGKVTPDSPARPLPSTELAPSDIAELRFDVTVRGYRMAQVDSALARVVAELKRRTEELDQERQRVAELEGSLAAADNT